MGELEPKGEKNEIAADNTRMSLEGRSTKALREVAERNPDSLTGWTTEGAGETLASLGLSTKEIVALAKELVKSRS